MSQFDTPSAVTSTCPHCASVMSVPVRLAGKKVRCAVCKRVFEAAAIDVALNEAISLAKPLDDEDEEEEADRPKRKRRKGGFRCVHCGSCDPPDVRQRTRTEGWVAFGILLLILPPVGYAIDYLFFAVSLPLCGLALLMREDYRVCSDCGIKLG